MIYGFVIGRFQPFHLGHLEYIKAAQARCDRLMIGIARPWNHHGNTSGPAHRLSRDNNPFSYFERHQMIEQTMYAEGFGVQDFWISPAPVDEMHLMEEVLPPKTSSIFMATIYDDWGHLKVRQIKELGYAVDILWERDPSSRLTSGSEVRRRWRQGEEWDELVPRPVAMVMEEIDLRSRER